MSRLIDADKLRKDIQFVLDTLGEPTRYGLRQAMSIIDRTPTVDTERHGQWIRTEAYPHKVVCSECHRTYVRNENIIEGRYKGDEIVPIYCTEAEYCPHCGALMDEVEE